jgi:hypothetical protein
MVEQTRVIDIGTIRRAGYVGKPARNQRQEAFQRLANGETQADIARTYAVLPATFGRMLGTAGGPFVGVVLVSACIPRARLPGAISSSGGSRQEAAH